MQSQVTQQEINQLLQRGAAALQQKDAQTARTAFQAIIDKGIANASVWLGLAYACRDMGDTEHMLKAVDQSLAITPQNARAYILKADHFENTGDMQAASAFYLKALNVAPPPAQTPADLKPELERAQARYTTLTSDFERHLKDQVEQKAQQAGTDGRRILESLDLMTGKKRYYTQQPKTYFFPGLPNIQFCEDDFPWIADVEAATDDIRKELLAVKDMAGGFSAYVTGGENRPQSDPHGMKDNENWSAFYLWKDGELVEENAARCPKTVEAMKKVPPSTIPGRAPNVLFSLLRPGAKIPPHHGLINTRYICHLPLIIPEGCGFRVGNDVREWQEGKVWVFDDTIEHEAWNKSDQDRYILLFEIWKPELSEAEHQLVGDIFKAIDSYGRS